MAYHGLWRVAAKHQQRAYHKYRQRKYQRNGHKHGEYQHGIVWRKRGGENDIICGVKWHQRRVP